jgi:acyl-CoA synthetase (AMP-forming)/AMP-acid ligase II
VPQPTLQRLREVLPQATLFTPYGSTEALPVTLISAEDIFATKAMAANSGEMGTLVGKPVSGVEVRVVEPVQGAISDAAQIRELQPGQIGEVLVCGQNVSRTYLNRPDATQRGKVQWLGKLWHRMGDVGYFDSEGNLYFCGRQAHAVKTPERVLFSIPVERIFNAHEKVRRSALVALANGSDGEAAVVVEPHPQFWPENAEERERFRSELLALARTHSLTSKIEKVFFHPSFPVDARHNAKIFRDKLGVLASQGKVH